MKEKIFLMYYIYYGLIIYKIDDKWVVIVLMWELVKVLIQFYVRIKLGGYEEFCVMMNMWINFSNNMVYVDVGGNIVYYYGNYIFI